MEYFTKVDILAKISKAIMLYAEISRVKKYIIAKKLLDENKLDYKVFFLDDDKMFEHSQAFKIFKRLLIDRRGNRKKDYYTYCTDWLNEKHKLYVEFKFFALKLINRNDKFTPQDLTELNMLYRKVKRLKHDRAKKT